MVTVYQPGSILIASPTGLERIEADNGGAILAEVSTGSLRDACGYQKATPLTGATLTMGSATSIQSVLAANPAGTISTLAVILPPAPVDGLRARIFSTQIVTTLTITAPGMTLNNAVTSLSANVAVEYLYSASNTTWDRCL